MRIKKKDLRKGLAQLPINYPDPALQPGAEPAEGGPAVERICRRLAHGEAAVRSGALAELPAELAELAEKGDKIEKTEKSEEAAALSCHRLLHNIPRALDDFRARAAAAARSGRDPLFPPTRDTEYRTIMTSWCEVELDFLKLSRGVFFCLWHSDKPLVQLECARRIAQLLHTIRSLRCKNLFYGAIFRVLSREWPTIDRYRMDKYLALVRMLIFEWISLLKNLEESEEEKDEEVGGSLDETSHVSKVEKMVLTETPMIKETSKATASKPAKRERNDEGNKNTFRKKNQSVESVGKTAPLTAIGIPFQYLERFYSNRRVLTQALLEFFYIFQEQIFPKSTSTGLTMHICDIAFDELSRASLSQELFITLSAGIPLYAMSQGNFIEKRVLDNFFPPLAGGVYTKQREEQLFEKKKQFVKASHKSSAKKKINAKEITRKRGAVAEDEWRQEARKISEEDTKVVLSEMAKCCQLYATSRGTTYAVRTMFSEADLVLRQAADPDSYQSLSPFAQRRRLEKEIDEVNETRGMVKTERTAVHQLKKKEKKQALLTKAKLVKRKTTGGDRKGKEGGPENDILEEGLKKKKKVLRNTKRKKNYQLTKDDLYGDHDDDNTRE
ncbi:unnamed protein product [Phytomonas sp. Hart1]|nr:unnamed protein product [Phytomonas sp. Hart1]|eukprot:CCW71677.1 unnamed protein product [Phytomonas sp. isolate Hart1]